MRYMALGLFLSCTVVIAQPAPGPEIALPAGTAVFVKLVDPIDSARDPFGRHYTASVAASVDVGREKIAAGSPATVVLMRNNSGWITRLTMLTVNGREVAVASAAGSVSNKPVQSMGPLQKMGILATSDPGPEQRVLLPVQAELRFQLLGSVTPVSSTKASSHSRTAARGERTLEASSARSHGGASAAALQEDSGINYLCSAKDKPDRALPTSYYIADVFETSADPVEVERRWYDFLASTYPYMFANNSHAIVRCVRIDDPAAERDARNELERQSKSDNAQIVQTRWHYTLGPPPAPAASSVP